MKNNSLFLKIYKNIIKKMSKGYGISKFYPIRSIIKKVESNMKSNFAEIQGSKMFLDTNDSLNLSILGVYGELDTKIIKKQLNENDIVIDVGANIGYYTLLSAKSVGNAGRVFAFEPEPENFKLLQKNIKVNNYKNTITENYAVSNTNGKISLFLAKNGIVGHRIYDSDDCSDSILVNKITLDDYFTKLNLLDKINFVKIDVEGFEFGVLKGMVKIIEKSKNLKLFVEFNRISLEEAGFNPKEMLDFLYERNFKIYFLNYKKNFVVKADKNELLTSKENLEENINILCSKQELSF
jgi:FkbM family methyltransferase